MVCYHVIMRAYVPVSSIVRTLVSLILKVWAYSSLVLALCTVLYFLYSGIVAFGLLILAFSGVLYHAQDTFLFHPEFPSHSKLYVPKPSSFGLPYEPVQVCSADGINIQLYFIHQPRDLQPLAPTIIFFHGNAGNMGHRLPNCKGMYHHLRCNVLLVEYRGYGLSEGQPSERGLYLDAMAGIDYLLTRDDVSHDMIILFGRSLGGAVAIDLAIREQYMAHICCVIVENTFTNIPDMAKVIVGSRLLNFLPTFFYKNKFMSLRKVRKLFKPTLFISGMADTMVPPRMMWDLYRECGSKCKQLLQLSNGTHNDTWTLPTYYRSIGRFLQVCIPQYRQLENDGSTSLTDRSASSLNFNESNSHTSLLADDIQHV